MPVSTLNVETPEVVAHPRPVYLSAVCVYDFRSFEVEAQS